MFRLTNDELDQLATEDLSKCRARLEFRNTLLTAVLISAPIRLKNLAMIRIGQHLQWQDGEGHLRFSASETKNRQALHMVLRATLNSHLERYISLLRPMFPNAADSNRLWLASKGKPMARHAIYDAVVRTSLRLFGTAIPPHGFRSIAATFLAEASPEDALRARPLLGHRNQETTETYYIKARQIDASRKVSEALIGIRGDVTNSRKTV